MLSLQRYLVDTCRVQAGNYFWWAARGIGKQRVDLNAPGRGFLGAEGEGPSATAGSIRKVEADVHHNRHDWPWIQRRRKPLGVREALRSQQKVSCTGEEEGGSHAKKKKKSLVAVLESQKEARYPLLIFRKTLNYTQPPFWEDYGILVSLGLLFTVRYLQLAQIPEACRYYQGFEFKDRLRNRLSKCVCHLSLIIVSGRLLDYSRYLAIQQSDEPGLWQTRTCFARITRTWPPCFHF